MAGSGVNLANAWVTITPTTKGIQGTLDQAFGGAEQSAERAGEKSGHGLMSKLGGVLKTGALAVGAAAGTVLATSLFKGWTRLGNIENAQAKLTGLGHSAESVKAIMDNALASVKGTAFGLDEAATVAAGAVASGIKPGKDLRRTLGLVGDAATIGGTSMSEMGAIFNKVAASGKIQGDVIAQLGDKGIPILQLLGKQIGKTPQETAKLASAGKIDFETFQKAMEDGLGGAALKSGETTAGAFKNMGAALSRFGAVLLKDVFPLAKVVFGGITTLLDNLAAKVGPVVQEFGARFGAALSRVGAAATGLFALFKSGDVTGGLTKALGVEEDSKVVDLLLKVRDGAVRAAAAVTGLFALFTTGDVTGGLTKALGVEEDSTIIDRLMTIRDGFGRVGDSLRSLGDSAVALFGPVKDIVGSLVQAFGQVSAAIGFNTWRLFVVALGAVADIVSAVLVPAVTSLSKWMKDNQGAVTVLAAGYVAWSLAVKAIALQKLITGLYATQKALLLTKLEWIKTTAAMVASKATTVALAALYAKDMVVNLAKATAGVVASSAAWVANTAALVAGKVAQVAIMAATKAWTAAQWLLNVALNANPIGLLVAAIALLVAGFIWAWNSSETFRNIVMGVLTAVGGFFVTIFNGIVSAVQSAWNWITSSVAAVGNAISTAFAAAGAFISGVWNGIKTAASNAWDWVKGVWSGIGGFFSGLMSGVANVFTSAWNGIVSVARSILGGIKDAVGGALNSAVAVVKGIINGAIGLVNGIVSGINAVIRTVNGAISWVPGLSAIPQVPKVPYLADGAVVVGPTLAMVGEGREPETVLPLSKLEAMLSPRGNDRPVNLNVYPRQEIDVPSLARQVARELAWGTA